MLLKEADEKVDDLTIVTVNASNTAVSENKVNLIPEPALQSAEKTSEP